MSVNDIHLAHEKWRGAQRAHRTLDSGAYSARGFSDLVLSFAAVLALFRATQMWYGWPTAQTDFVVGRSFNMAGQLYAMFALSLFYIALNFREFMAGLAQAGLLLRIFIFFIGISILVSPDKAASLLALTSVASMMLPPLLYYWRFGSAGAFKLFRIFSMFTIVVNLVYAVVAPKYAFMSGSLAGDMRGMFPHKNNFGHMMALMFIILLPTFGRRIFSPQSIVQWAFCGLAFICVVLSHSSTAFIDVLAGVALIVMSDTVRRFPGLGAREFVAIALFFGLLAMLYFGGMLVASSIAEGAGKDLTFSGRTDIWAAVLPHLLDYPVTGYGFGIMRLPIYIEPILAHVPFPVNSPHNTYLEMALNLGIPATICWILFLIGRLFTKMTMTVDSNDECAFRNREVAVITMVMIASLMDAGRMFAPNATWPVLVMALPLWHAYDPRLVRYRRNAKAAGPTR